MARAVARKRGGKRAPVRRAAKRALRRVVHKRRAITAPKNIRLAGDKRRVVKNNPNSSLQRSMGEELERIRKANPGISSKDAFRIAYRNVAKKRYP